MAMCMSMATRIGLDGIEYSSTHVLVPTHLKDFAKGHRVSMSKILREGLEREKERDDAVKVAAVR